MNWAKKEAKQEGDMPHQTNRRGEERLYKKYRKVGRTITYRQTAAAESVGLEGKNARREERCGTRVKNETIQSRSQVTA